MALEGAPQTIAPGSSPATTSAPTVTIAVEDYQRFRGIEKQLLDFQSEKAKELDAKEQERLKALADAGKAEQALKEQRTSWESKLAESSTRYAELERGLFDREKNVTLAGALNSRTFSGSTPEHKAAQAAQLRMLLADRFETSRLTDGSLVVRDKASGRPAADVLTEALASPEFSHFFIPTSRGGSGVDATRTGMGPQQSANPHPPGTVQAIAWDFKAKNQLFPSFGLTGIAPMPPVQGR